MKDDLIDKFRHGARLDNRPSPQTAIIEFPDEQSNQLITIKWSLLKKGDYSY